MFEYIGLALTDVAYIVCGIGVSCHACQSIGISYACAVGSKYILMRAAVTARFGERRLLVDDIQRVSLIPGVGEVVVSGEARIEIGNFHKCAEVDVEVGIAVVPSAVFVPVPPK